MLPRLLVNFSISIYRQNIKIIPFYEFIILRETSANERNRNKYIKFAFALCFVILIVHI